MENENINSVVDCAFNDNAVGMRDALYNAINDKVFAAIEARKQEVARNLISTYDNSQEETEPTETENE